MDGSIRCKQNSLVYLFFNKTGRKFYSRNYVVVPQIESLHSSKNAHETSKTGCKIALYIISLTRALDFGS